MTRAVEAQARLNEAEAQQRVFRDARDAAIRTAREYGWTYDQLISRLGINSGDIVSALRRTSRSTATEPAEPNRPA